MSDDLVRRLTEGRTAGTALRWAVADIHREAAAALVAKDAEIARLRIAVEFFIAYDDSVDSSGVQMMLAYDDAIIAARSALNNQHKGETP